MRLTKSPKKCVRAIRQHFIYVAQFYPVNTPFRYRSLGTPSTLPPAMYLRVDEDTLITKFLEDADIFLSILSFSHPETNIKNDDSDEGRAFCSRTAHRTKRYSQLLIQNLRIYFEMMENILLRF